MSGPWEKYASSDPAAAETPAAGPWEKYGGAAAPLKPSAPLSGGGEIPPNPEKPPQDPPGPLGKALDYVVSQGGVFDPATGKRRLIGDAIAALEGSAGLGPAAGGGAVGKGLLTAADKTGGAIAKTAGAAPGAVGKGISDVIGGIGTHTGGESIRQAFQAGREGGDKARAFLDALRGNAPMGDVVDAAKEALAHMRTARGAAYRAGMAGVKGDATVLKFDAIDKALADAAEIGTYKGRAVNHAAVDTLTGIKKAIADWKKADPKEFHTVEGLDALKQSIGAFREDAGMHGHGTQAGTQARLIADKVYHAVRQTIADQAPAYGRVMQDYEAASEALRELERGLSIPGGGRGTTDAALRKLQSVMRNNVNTNYGNRLGMARTLDQAGGGKIMPQLVGHALNSPTPRGLGGIQAGGEIAGAVAGNPGLLALLPFQSPRLMGEASYYAGKGLGKAAELGDVLKSVFGIK